MLIPLAELVTRHEIKPTGFFHVGANDGQELDDYLTLSENIVFVEAIPAVFRKLVSRCRKHDKVKSFCALLAEEGGLDVKFNIASNEGQSSSALEFGTHAQAHPTVKYVGTIPLTTMRGDQLLKDNNLNLKDYDFLNVDVQGMELSVLKGLGSLHEVNFAYIEVNIKEVYKGCPLVEEIDEYLAFFRLYPVEQHMTGHGWGDKFYMR